MGAFFKGAVLQYFDIPHMGKMYSSHLSVFANQMRDIVAGGAAQAAAAKAEAMVGIIIKRKETVNGARP